MIEKFKFVHGIYWIIWVAIVFALMIIVFFVGVWGNLLTLLMPLGFESDVSTNALFWLFVSLMFLTALRGAKCEVTLSND